MGVSRVRDVALDQRFAIPPGVIDVREANNADGDWYYDDSTRAEEGPILVVPDAPLPSPPSTYEIYEQKVRTASDGRSVVDVTLNFADVPGVTNIEVRVTKL